MLEASRVQWRCPMCLRKWEDVESRECDLCDAGQGKAAEIALNPHLKNAEFNKNAEQTSHTKVIDGADHKVATFIPGWNPNSKTILKVDDAKAAQTGTEGEVVVYRHRAKLFRFSDIIIASGKSVVSAMQLFCATKRTSRARRRPGR